MQINGFLRDLGVSDSQEVVPRAGRHPLLVALVALVAAECVLLLVATGYLIIELLVDTPASVPSAIALTVLTALSATFLAVVVVNILRGRAWTRGATIVWQVLQIAVAVGCFQGIFARPDIGWALLLPSIVVIVLLFTKPVIAATALRD